MKAHKLIPLLIVVAGIWAYANSFQSSFLFDDIENVVENTTIRHLWPIGQALLPQRGTGISARARPIVNLTLAVNYAAGGLQVWGYHAVNLTLHILAGLTLFGIVRRTLLQPALSQRFGATATPLALVIALLWTVHPLQTESVTWTTQRAESLMGLFYLLTLYCVIRGATPSSSIGWYSLAAAACLLGMGTKEVMVTAPLIVLLYDRTFLSGSFAEAWRRRWTLYLALGATWILLGSLMLSAGNYAGTVGFNANVSWQSYALTQTWAVLHYLRLCLWPHPLVFYYGTGLTETFADVAPYAFFLLALLGFTLIALIRWPAWGFLAAWFFVILAPSSSIVPVATETVAEHRTYLPLAGVIALAVIGSFLLGKCLINGPRRAAFGGVAGGFAVVVLGILTIHRNQDYRSELTIWQDTVAHRPDNDRAHNNLGNALAGIGRTTEAIAQYQQAVQLNPDYVRAQYNLGTAMARVGRMNEAIDPLERAVQLKPDYAEAHDNLGSILARVGRIPEAITHLEQAVQLKPDYAEAHNNLGSVLAGVGRVTEATTHLEQAVRLKPDYAKAHNNLGGVLARAGHMPEAISHFEQAVRSQPDFVEARYNLGTALAQQGRIPEAIAQYEEVVRLKPDFTEARNTLARLRTTP